MRSKLRREKQASKQAEGSSVALPTNETMGKLDCRAIQHKLCAFFVHINVHVHTHYIELRFCWMCFESLAQNARVDYFSISKWYNCIALQHTNIFYVPRAQWPTSCPVLAWRGPQCSVNWRPTRTDLVSLTTLSVRPPLIRSGSHTPLVLWSENNFFSNNRCSLSLPRPKNAHAFKCVIHYNNTANDLKSFMVHVVYVAAVDIEI